MVKTDPKKTEPASEPPEVGRQRVKQVEVTHPDFPGVVSKVAASALRHFEKVGWRVKDKAEVKDEPLYTPADKSERLTAAERRALEIPGEEFEALLSDETPEGTSNQDDKTVARTDQES